MRKTTIRSVLKALLLPDLVLAIFLLWDFFANQSQWMWPLLSVAAILLMASVLLLFLEPKARYMRLPTPPQEEPKTIIYRRT